MLSEKHLQGIASRGIDEELATRMGLYSGTFSRDGSVIADLNGKILCFPFFEHGEEVNTKYRWSQDGQRRFMQRKNAVKTPYNVDVILNVDSLLELSKDDGTHQLVWTEGEFDCLAAIQCGFPHAISLPDGAVAARDGQGNLLPPVPDDTRDIDPENDDKFSFFKRHFEPLSMVKIHIIATDDDEPGRRMAKELVRRIGAARCMMVTYPADKVVPDKKAKPEQDGSQPLRSCKDLNEVLQYLGSDRVKEILTLAKAWPVRGLYKLSDYPDQEDPVTYSTGICELLDEHFRFFDSAFVVVTGVPRAGKSTLINQMAVGMAKLHRWPVTIFSGEMPVKPYLSNPLMTAFLNKPKSEWSRQDRSLATEFVERYFSFIDYSLRAGEEEADIDIDFIIAKGADACFRYGTRLMVVDPWNEVEHGSRPGNMNQSEHIGRSIRKLKRFGKEFNCAVVVVAHPTKMGSGEVPGLYSISDSSNFANKAEVGMVVHAPDPMLPAREIIIPKVKFHGTGMKGIVPLAFDMDTQLFRPARVDPMAPVA